MELGSFSSAKEMSITLASNHAPILGSFASTISPFWEEKTVSPKTVHTSYWVDMMKVLQHILRSGNFSTMYINTHKTSYWHKLSWWAYHALKANAKFKYCLNKKKKTPSLSQKIDFLFKNIFLNFLRFLVCNKM